MKKSIIYCIKHAPFENEGSIADWINLKEYKLISIQMWKNVLLPDPESVNKLIIMGGPMSINEEKQYSWLKEEKQFISQIIKKNKPVFGICLGAQLIANVLGAQVIKAPQKEIGWWPVKISSSKYSSDIPSLTTFLWHGETFTLPLNASLFANSEAVINQGFYYKEKVIGLQFHPEMTYEGILSLIKNCPADLTEGKFIQTPLQMLSDKKYFEENKKFLFSLLEKLFS